MTKQEVLAILGRDADDVDRWAANQPHDQAPEIVAHLLAILGDRQQRIYIRTMAAYSIQALSSGMEACEWPGGLVEDIVIATDRAARAIDLDPVLKREDRDNLWCYFLKMLCMRATLHPSQAAWGMPLRALTAFIISRTSNEHIHEWAKKIMRRV